MMNAKDIIISVANHEFDTLGISKTHARSILEEEIDSCEEVVRDDELPERNKTEYRTQLTSLRVTYNKLK